MYIPHHDVITESGHREVEQQIQKCFQPSTIEGVVFQNCPNFIKFVKSSCSVEAHCTYSMRTIFFYYFYCTIIWSGGKDPSLKRIFEQHFVNINLVPLWVTSISKITISYLLKLSFRSLTTNRSRNLNNGVWNMYLFPELLSLRTVFHS